MKRTFPATLEGLSACQEFLSSVCESPKPQIIMDEIVSNIVRCSGADDFEVSLEMTDDSLTMVFSDGGRQFDPTQQPDPDVTLSAEDRSIGGLGLFMVRKMAKHVEYAYRDGRNVLTVETAR